MKKNTILYILALILCFAIGCGAALIVLGLAMATGLMNRLLTALG